MHEQPSNDMHNQPLSDEKIKQEERPHNKEGNKAEQKIAVNPNPRANENIKDRTSFPGENELASQAGSEITDGEDG